LKFENNSFFLLSHSAQPKLITWPNHHCPSSHHRCKSLPRNALSRDPSRERASARHTHSSSSRPLWPRPMPLLPGKLIETSPTTPPLLLLPSQLYPSGPTRRPLATRGRGGAPAASPHCRPPRFPPWPPQPPLYIATGDECPTQTPNPNLDTGCCCHRQR
jgi:hypothetical protein